MGRRVRYTVFSSLYLSHALPEDGGVVNALLLMQFLLYTDRTPTRRVSSNLSLVVFFASLFELSNGINNRNRTIEKRNNYLGLFTLLLESNIQLSYSMC